jgi:hypothetical protein
MNSSLASTDFSRARRTTEPSNEPLLQPAARNLITRARLRLGKLVSFAFARHLMMFFIGVAATLAWQSYSGAARKAIASWSPHLAWVAPTAARGKPVSRAAQSHVGRSRGSAAKHRQALQRG